MRSTLIHSDDALWNGIRSCAVGKLHCLDPTSFQLPLSSAFFSFQRRDVAALRAQPKEKGEAN